jgi:hypothetical protein
VVLMIPADADAAAPPDETVLVVNIGTIEAVFSDVEMPADASAEDILNTFVSNVTADENATASEPETVQIGGIEGQAVNVGGLIPGTDLEGEGRVGVATFGDGNVASIIGTKTSDRTDIDIMQSVDTVFETLTVDATGTEGSDTAQPDTGEADNGESDSAAVLDSNTITPAIAPLEGMEAFVYPNGLFAMNVASDWTISASPNVRQGNISAIFGTAANADFGDSFGAVTVAVWEVDEDLASREDDMLTQMLADVTLRFGNNEGFRFDVDWDTNNLDQVEPETSPGGLALVPFSVNGEDPFDCQLWRMQTEKSQVDILVLLRTEHPDYEATRATVSNAVASFVYDETVPIEPAPLSAEE